MCNAYNHPPGCACGWGGDGNGGHGYGGGSWSASSYSAPVVRNVQWRERDFTRPSSCPECGEDVFFIRHNGGSVWVDPPLGWPWPKHGCFDRPSEATGTFSLWTAKSSGLTNPKLAIITRIKSDVRFAEPVLEIRFTDDSRGTLILRYTPSDESLIGTLVVVSIEDGLLLHRQHAEIPFHSFTPLALGSRDWYTCSRCHASVQGNTGHEEFCRTHHGASLRFKQAKSRRVAKLQKLPPSQHNIVSAKRVQQEAVRVANQAWALVVHVEGATKQFKQAKQEALRLIAKLTTSVKGQVEHHFITNRWKPLLAAKPTK